VNKVRILVVSRDHTPVSVMVMVMPIHPALSCLCLFGSSLLIVVYGNTNTVLPKYRTSKKESMTLPRRGTCLLTTLWNTHPYTFKDRDHCPPQCSNSKIHSSNHSRCDNWRGSLPYHRCCHCMPARCIHSHPIRCPSCFEQSSREDCCSSANP